MRHRAVVPGIAVLATSAVLATVTVAPAGAVGSPGIGPLPWRSARATWTSASPAPGVEVRTASVTVPDAHLAWAVTVQAPAVNRLTGAATWAELGDREWAGTAVARLAGAGITARTAAVRWPAFADTPRGIEGYRVRAGSFAAQADARRQATAVTAAGLHAVVEWTGYDVDQVPDRETIRVVTVDPARFRGRVIAYHGAAVAGRSTTSAQARAVGSAVAVNGGFFITSDADGVQGTQSGIAAYRGTLDAQSAGARAALILAGRRARIANLVSRAAVRDGAASFPVNGIDRLPGKVRDCGRPALSPTVLPRQDVTCTATDDLVLFTPDYGAGLPAGARIQVLLGPGGRVTSVGAPGGRVPDDGTPLQGVGAAAAWLRDHAVPGHRLRITEEIRDTAGRTVPLTRGTGIVSAAPMLLRDGRPYIDAATEGVVDPKDLSFGYAWAEQRQPRTLAGTDGRGRLLLVTVDGRSPGSAEGVTIEEASEVMRALGAVDALNLDGGGSTTMAVDGTVVNDPSDAAGERPVGDTVQIVP